MNLPITGKAFVRYAVLPGIRPRMADLFTTGFHHVAFFIALVYQIVRLLPAGHPYANPANIGKFGIRHVIAEAANNLVVKRENIDQILLFIVILLGMIIMGLQIVMLFFGLVFQPAMAAMPTNFAEFFLTPAANEPHDIAGILLDMVFGVPGIYDSCITGSALCEDANGLPIIVDPTINGAFSAAGGFLSPFNPATAAFWPYPAHIALQDMFGFYSYGLLVIAVMIACYFIATILLETAQSGTPFGRRFNRAWAPIRFVMAFGLLIPVGYGLNSSQFIVLYAAKFGTGFANNGWRIFNDVLTTSYLGDVANLISTPNIPEVGGLLQFFDVARTCYHLERIKNDREIRAYAVKDPWAVPTNALEITPGLPFQNVRDFYGEESNTIVIRFGVRDENNYGLYKGFVKPICGEITMQLSDSQLFGLMEPGVRLLEVFYYGLLIQTLWHRMIFYPWPDYALSVARTQTPWWPCDPSDPACALPPDDYKREVQAQFAALLQAGILGAVSIHGLSPRWLLNLAIMERKGWAGAGIWYNRVAEMNGNLTTAAFATPVPTLYPEIMEYIRVKKKQYDQDTSSEFRYEPRLANGRDIFPERPEDLPMARAMNYMFQYWQADGHVATSHSETTGNVVIDVINALFGTEGLYNMRRNADVHPLAQLVGVGRSLIEAAIRNLGFATVGGVGGAVFSALDGFFGKLGGTASGFLISFAMIGLTLGFVLFYVLPFLPFIYFYFAVGGWIKGIFEAMVGAPLWALAHLRIDGNGLPGQAAINGYFLIFEIFLRPLLILFGLLASISIFSALVSVLNAIFDLVTQNLTGFDVTAQALGINDPLDIEFYRAPVDEFFFTVIYTIVVYMIGMSSFKLIDLIPNNMMRWMGQSVATFNDQREDPAQGLMSTAAIGGQQVISSIGGGLKNLAGMASSAGARA